MTLCRVKRSRLFRLSVRALRRKNDGRWEDYADHPHSRRAGSAAVDVDVGYGYHEDRTPTHGYEPTREAAKATFAKSWRRSGPV
jgi:hypothetical protein